MCGAVHSVRNRSKEHLKAFNGVVIGSIVRNTNGRFVVGRRRFSFFHQQKKQRRELLR
jgi:hypothetical protein